MVQIQVRPPFLIMILRLENKLDDYSPMLIDKSKMLDVRESHFIWQVNKFVERNESSEAKQCETKAFKFYDFLGGQATKSA